MSGDEEPFAVGEMVYVSSGEYSDYGVLCVARVLKPFDIKAFATTRQRNYSSNGYSVDHARLTREGYIEELPAREIWTGRN